MSVAQLEKRLYASHLRNACQVIGFRADLDIVSSNSGFGAQHLRAYLIFEGVQKCIQDMGLKLGMRVLQALVYITPLLILMFFSVCITPLLIFDILFLFKSY